MNNKCIIGMSLLYYDRGIYMFGEQAKSFSIYWFSSFLYCPFQIGDEEDLNNLLALGKVSWANIFKYSKSQYLFHSQIYS